MKRMSPGRALGAAAVMLVAGRVAKGIYRRYKERDGLEGFDARRLTGKEAEKSPIADDSIETEASMESFPASDPPAWTTGPSESC